MLASSNVDAICAQILASSTFIHLNTGWQGPSPLCVTGAVQEALQAEGRTAPPPNEHRLAVFRQARRKLSNLAHERDAYLWQRSRIVARTVPDTSCTRLSLHVFNTEAEVDAAVKTIAELARAGSP